jgi:hypothetical protein
MTGFSNSPKLIKGGIVLLDPETVLVKIDIKELAKFDEAGGNIHNIALNAAFLAAETSEALTMAHLAQAARRELGKLEKTARESELRSWA